MYQKAFRDHLIVSVFDGSSTVCLDSLSFQLKSANKGRSKKVNHLDQAEAKARYHQLYDLQVKTDAIDFRELEIFNRDGDLVMESLGTIIKMLNDADVTEGLTAEILSPLRERADQLLIEQRTLDQKFRIISQIQKRLKSLKHYVSAWPVTMPSYLLALLCWVFGYLTVMA